MSDPAHPTPAPATPDPPATPPAGAAAGSPPSPEQVWTNDVFASLSSTPVPSRDIGNAQNAVRTAINDLVTFDIFNAASFHYALGEIANFPDQVLDLEPPIVQRVANTRRGVREVLRGVNRPLAQTRERFQDESVANFLRRRAFEEAQNETRLYRKVPMVKGVLRWLRKRDLTGQYQVHMAAIAAAPHAAAALRAAAPPIIQEAELRSRKQVHHGHEYNYNHLENRLQVETTGHGAHGEPIREALDRVLTPGQRSPNNAHYLALARLLTADPAARESFGQRVYGRIHHGDERKPELERNLKNTQDRIAALDGLVSSYDTLLTEQGKLQDFDREMLRLDGEMTVIQGQITTLSAGIGGITNRRRITELRQDLAERRQERETMRQQWRQSYQLFMDTRVKMSSFARQLPDEPILNFDPTARAVIAATAPFLTPSVFVQRLLLRHPLNPGPPPAFIPATPPLPVDDAVVTQSLSSLRELKNDRTGWTGWQTEERHLKQELEHLDHAPASAHHKVSAEQLLYLVLEDRLEHRTPSVTDPYTVKLAVNMAFVDANTNMYRNANRELARDFLRGRATRFLDNRRGLSFQDVLERLATMEEYKDLRKLVRSPRRKPITINDVRGLRIDRDLLMHLSSMLEETLGSFQHQQASGKQSTVKLRDRDALHLQNLISLIQQVWAERDAQSFSDSVNPANSAKLSEQFPELKNVGRREDLIINLLQAQSTHRDKRREAIQKLYPNRPEWKTFLDKRDYAERMKESREQAASLTGADRQQFLQDLGVTDLAYSVPFLMSAGDWWKKRKFDKEALKAREKAEQELEGGVTGSRIKRRRDILSAPFRAYGKLVKFFWWDIPKAVTKPFRPVTDPAVDSGIDAGKYIFSKRFFPIALASWILRAPLVVGLSSDDRKKYLQGRKAEAEEGKAEREKAREARRQGRAQRRAPKAEKPKAVRRRRAEAAAPSAPAQAPAQPAAPAVTHAPSVAAPTAPTTAPATPAPTQAATHTAPPTVH